MFVAVSVVVVGVAAMLRSRQPQADPVQFGRMIIDTDATVADAVWVVAAAAAETVAGCVGWNGGRTLSRF